MIIYKLHISPQTTPEKLLFTEKSNMDFGLCRHVERPRHGNMLHEEMVDSARERGDMGYLKVISQLSSSCIPHVSLLMASLDAATSHISVT